eukprot:2999496-Amphidinium_carterae.1
MLDLQTCAIRARQCVSGRVGRARGCPARARRNSNQTMENHITRLRLMDSDVSPNQRVLRKVGRRLPVGSAEGGCGESISGTA